MGIIAKGFQQIVGMIHRHHRTMARSPVHITRETTHAFYTRLNLNRPWLYLQQQQSRLTHTLSLRRADLTQLAMQSSTPDICVLTPDYPENHIPIPASTDDHWERQRCPGQEWEREWLGCLVLHPRWAAEANSFH